MNTKKRVGIYARVSTAGQDTENQLLELRRYCAARGWEVMEYKDEGLSGTLNEDKRPALRQLMQDASRRKITAVVAWDFSRLARSLRNLLDVASRLNEAGCALVTLRENVDTETANGRLMLGIFGSLAEFERELIRERILLGLKKSKALGRVPGPKRAPVDLSALRAQAAAGVSCRKLGALFGVSKDTARNLLKAEPLLAS